MTDLPWADDACSLVEAFRSGQRSPVEEMEATLAAIERSDLNCFSHVDAERALEAARSADVSRPFGGVPAGVKELDHVEGWPDTQASLVFKDRVANETSTAVGRFSGAGGAALVGLTTASEFGGLNVSVTKLNGVTHNPWQHGRSVGGSSCGSAAAVAGGLVSIATAADGGGSIRIPAGYAGLVGMKGTYGRIPRGPSAYSRPSTEVYGCLARSVRDTARHYDVATGYDTRDPWSLPSDGKWESGLGQHDLQGLRVAVIPSISGVVLEDGVEERVREHAAALIAATGMVQVDLDLDVPNVTVEWMMGNTSTVIAELGALWPHCARELTDALTDGLRLSETFYNLHVAGVAEAKRLKLNHVMADAFDQVDLIVVATNPGPAFAAEAQMSATPSPVLDKLLNHRAARGGVRGALAGLRVVNGVAPRTLHKGVERVTEAMPEIVSMGGLTILSNIYGNPAVSIPAGLVDGLPVGIQVLAPHHADSLLLDVALAAERELPWPRLAPGAPQMASA